MSTTITQIALRAITTRRGIARLSIGLEDVELLRTALEQALAPE